MYFWFMVNLDHMIRKRHPHTSFWRRLPGSAGATGHPLAPSAIGPNLHAVLCQSASALYSGGLRAGNYSTSCAYDANSNLTSITRMAIEGLHEGGAFGIDGKNAAAKGIMDASKPQKEPLFLRFEQGQIVRNDPPCQYYFHPAR